MAQASRDPREEIQSTLRGVWLEDFHTLRERVLTEGSVEDLRKFVETAGKYANLEPDRKADPMASLPMFNIIFENGGVQVNSIAAPAQPAEVIEAEVVEVAPPAPEAEPAPVEAAEPPETDLLVQELDDVLDDLLGDA